MVTSAFNLYFEKKNHLVKSYSNTTRKKGHETSINIQILETRNNNNL